MSKQILAQCFGDWAVYLSKIYLVISALQLSMSSAGCQVSISPLMALSLRAEVTTTKVALVGVFVDISLLFPWSKLQVGGNERRMAVSIVKVLPSPMTSAIIPP